MNHTTFKLRKSFRTILFTVGLLFASTIIEGAYTVGALDTTANGGTGFGNADPASATGYVTTDATSQAFGTAVQPDGKVVVVGQTDDNYMAIVRYNIDGTIDTTFNTDGIVTEKFSKTSAVGTAVTVLPNGKIIVVGYVLDGNFKFFVAQFLPNGSLDTTGFGSPNGYVIGNVDSRPEMKSSDVANAVVVDSAGNIYAIGTTYQAALVWSSCIFVARYTSAGVLDATYNATGTGSGGGAGVTSAGIALISMNGKQLNGIGAAIDSSGKIVLTGTNSTDVQLFIARLTGGGILDTTFNTTGYNELFAATGYAVGFQSDGKIIVAGSTATKAAVIRYTTNGTLDPSFGISSSGYNATVGGTARGLAIQSDDKIVVSGTSPDADFLIARYLVDGSELDSTFGTSGSTTTAIGTTDVGNALAIQQNGSFILAGTSDGDFATARYLGTQGVQGAIDFRYPATLSTDDAPGYNAYPTDATAANKPQVVASYPLPNGQMYVVTKTTAGTPASQVVLLNADGSVAATAVAIAQSGANDVIADSQGRAVVVGGNGINGWIARYKNENGSMIADTTFNNGALVVNTSSGSFIRVGEQSTGKLVVAGHTTNFRPPLTNYTVRYNDNGVIDSSFTSPGYNLNPYDLVIDASNHSYLSTWQNDNTPYIWKLDENGSNNKYYPLNGTPSIFINMGCAFNKTEDAFFVAAAAAVSGSGLSIGDIAIYVTPTATFSSVAPTIFGTILQTTTLLLNPVITKLQCDTKNRLVFTGYDDNNFFVGRCVAGEATLDTTFAPYSSCPGILKTNYNDNNPTDSTTPQRVAYNVSISTTGNILLSGYENIDSTQTVSVLGQVVGDTAATQVDRFPGLSLDGLLDTTFNAAGTTPGFMNLKTELPTDLPSQVTAVTSLLQSSNGTYYVGSFETGDTDSYIIQMSADGVQNTGWASSGLLQLAGKPNLAAMAFLQSGHSIVVGGSGQYSGWAVQFDPSTGVLNTDFDPAVTLDEVYTVAQQPNGRILVAGVTDGTDATGAIMAYNPNTGALDTTFGTDGVYRATGYGVINSMIVDATGAIYLIAHDDLNNAHVVKIVSQGTGLDSNWTIPTVATDSTLAANNHLAFNQAGDILATAVDTTNNVMHVNLYSAADGTASATLGLSEAGAGRNFATGIVNPRVTSIAVDLNASPGKVIVTGYDSNTTPETPFVIRTKADIAAGPDTTFNSSGTHPGIQTIYAADSSTGATWNTAMINANGKITVAGSEVISSVSTPYMMRLYGDEFIGQYFPTMAASPAAGTPGTINTSYATFGYVSFIGDGQADSAIPQVVLPDSTGLQYVAFSDGTISRYTNANDLDTSYNSTGHATASQPGVYSMSFLAHGGLLVAGTNPAGATNGWVEQYTTAGIPDPSFSGNGIINLADGTKATVAVQQSSGRIVVAGHLPTFSQGALFAFTSAGVPDATFAIGSGDDTGVYAVGVPNSTVYAMIADQYDRLIIAYVSGSDINLRRLTSSGTLDTTFGTNGTIETALSGSVIDPTQVRVAIDGAGNIVIAACISSLANPTIALRAYENGVGTIPAYAQLTLPSLVTPVLTGLIATADGNVLVSGNSTTDTYQMWVARITSGGMLDTTFNPDETAGAIPGIMQFAPDAADTATGRNLTSMAIYPDGEISMVGTETSSTSTLNNPFMSRAYNSSYTTQQPIDLQAKAQGTVDLTFGAGVEPYYVENGITFLATAEVGTGSQTARAAAIQDGNANNVVVALQGTSSQINGGTSTNIYLNMFDVDGLLHTSFNSGASSPYLPGQMAISTAFDNQFVNDMVTFRAADGVSKAILAGYATNTTPSLTGSLLMQVNLATATLDATFGGLNGNAAGLAFGDAQQLNTVGLQSTGRIVAAGLDQSNNGLVLGYTAAGNLDQSFGQGGTCTQGETGIYASAIDSSDRVVVVYNLGGTVTLARILADGSGLDSAFNGGLPLSTTITTAILDTANFNNLRLVIDSSNNIAVVAVLNGATSFAVARYTSLGVLSGTVATIGGTMSLTDFTITKLLVDAHNAVVVVGYDNAATDMVVVARLVYASGAYELDLTFNETGFVKYAVNDTTTQTTAGAFIHPDGRIIIAGAQQ